jgi:DNA-binding NtrC family response regulator
MATFFPTDGLTGGEPQPVGAPLDLRSRVLAYERRLIEVALAEAGGNQRRAARLLGLLPTTLHEKIKRLGLRTAGPADGPVPAPEEMGPIGSS